MLQTDVISKVIKVDRSITFLYFFMFLGGDSPLAMKMMFNFHAESNAQAILKSMQKETIVSQNIADLPKSSNAIKITPHPNIVKMYTAFSDYIPSLSESMELYPHALPPRINPQGKISH